MRAQEHVDSMPLPKMRQTKVRVIDDYPEPVDRDLELNQAN